MLRSTLLSLLGERKEEKRIIYVKTAKHVFPIQWPLLFEDFQALVYRITGKNVTVVDFEDAVYDKAKHKVRVCNTEGFQALVPRHYTVGHISIYHVTVEI